MSWILLLASFIWELIRGVVMVAALVLRPGLRLQPAIIAYPLTVSTDAQITLFANLITLTPGALSVDVSDDRKTLYIHTIDLRNRDWLVGRLASVLETRVLRAMR